MPVTSTDIALGVCDVTYKGTDLGSTKGGVQVQIQTETYEVKVDQLGESPVKDIITGTMITVTVPMAETNLTRLQSLMAQSINVPAAASLPTGRAASANYAVGVTSIVTTGSGGGAPTAGQTFTFADHATRYRVVSWVGGTNTLTFVQDEKGTGGLVAPVTSAEALTFTAKSQGIEIRSGVNTDLLTSAGQLKLHPTGVNPLVTDQDFVAFLASAVPNFTFRYAFNEERIYEVTFKCYPDTANNNRIAVLGAP